MDGVTGTIEHIRFTGKTYEITVDLGETVVHVRTVDPPERPGGRVRVSIRSYLEPGDENGGETLLEPRTPLSGEARWEEDIV
jgi:hypothetical protein